MIHLHTLPPLRGLLCLCLLLGVPLATWAQEATLFIVSQQEDDGFFTTISAALDAIPIDMDGHYVIEIRNLSTTLRHSG